MTVDDQIRTMTIDNFCKPRCPQKWINFRRLALHGGDNWSVVQHYYPLFGPQLRHSPLQLESLVDRGTDECLYFRLAKGRQHAPAKSTYKALGPREADAAPLVCASVQHLDALLGQHAHEFDLAVALVIVIAKHRDNWQTQPYKYIQ